MRYVGNIVIFPIFGSAYWVEAGMSVESGNVRSGVSTFVVFERVE